MATCTHHAMAHDDWTSCRGPEAWRGPARYAAVASEEAGKAASPATARKAQFRPLEFLAEELERPRLAELAGGYASWKSWEKCVFLKRAASLLSRGAPWILGRLAALEEWHDLSIILNEQAGAFVFGLSDEGLEAVVQAGFLVDEVDFGVRDAKGTPLLHALVRRPYAFILALAYGARLQDKGPRGESLLPAVVRLALDVFRTPAGGALEAVPREKAEGLLRILGARKKQPWGASAAEEADAAAAFDSHRREARASARGKAGPDFVTLAAVRERCLGGAAP